MSYSVSISGHQRNPVGASCYYGFADGRPSKSASFSGSVREAGEAAIAWIEACQAEEDGTVSDEPVAEPAVDAESQA